MVLLAYEDNDPEFKDVEDLSKIVTPILELLCPMTDRSCEETFRMNLALTENALLVLRKRILARNHAGDIIENPEQMFRRVAHRIASADLEYGTAAGVAASEHCFFEVMTRLEFLPNSPTLMNAGRDLA